MMNQAVLSSNLSVSVVIPVYNGEAFLHEAISSALHQTVTPREIIVIDDGSTDRTFQIASGFGPPVLCYRQEHQGPPAARNCGIERATSEWIGLLDSDDVWPNNSLELQLNQAATDPTVQVVAGYARLWTHSEGILLPQPSGIGEEPRLFLGWGSVLIRKSLFSRLGMLNAQFLCCDDWDWFMRARELGIRMHIHNGLVLHYRRHGQNLTNNHALNNRFVIKMLKQSLDRRRAAGGEAVHSLPSLKEITSMEQNEG
jgi:glycosyltransferase involved in cell wall biosynthesis